MKAVDGIDDEAIRGKAHDALKAQNAKMHGAFETVGTAAAPDVEKSANTRKSAEAELDRLTDEMVAKDGGSRVDAYMKVADANPKLYAKAVGA